MRPWTTWTKKLYGHQSTMSSSKKLTGKRTLQQVFIRVYSGDTVVMLVFFDPAVAPLTFSLVQLSPPPHPLLCVRNIQFTRIHCVVVWYRVLGLRKINT